MDIQLRWWSIHFHTDSKSISHVFRAFQAGKLEQLAQVFKVLDHTSYSLSLSSLGIRYSCFSTFHVNSNLMNDWSYIICAQGVSSRCFNTTRTSRINLVDLAGAGTNERDATKHCVEEDKFLKKSLSELGYNFMNSLCYFHRSHQNRELKNQQLHYWSIYIVILTIGAAML